MSQPSSRPVPPQQGLHARHQRAYAAASHRFHTTLAAQPPLIDHDVLVRERPVVDALRLKLAQLTERRELYAKGSLQTLEITEQFMELRVDYDLRFWRSFRVNDLPPEIILEIIRYACWSHGDGVRPRSTVTQTCRLWRQLALGDSMLWSAIYFRMADFPFRRCYAWMDRAGRAPLHIRFDDGGQGEGERHITDQEIRPFLDRLFEHIYHVQSLIIIVSDWEPLLTFVKRLHAISRIGRPLIIQRLEIHRSGDLYVWPGANRIIKGHDVTLYPALGGPVAPMLEWLSFDGIHFDWPASSISNLTTLDLRRLPLELAPSRKSFREMLYSSPKLLRLTLDGAGPKEFFDPACTIPPIRLNNLKILILCNFSPVYVKGILQNISAPNVQDLQIMCFMRNDYKDVWSFMSGQFPNVKILVMLKIDIQMPDGLHALTRLLASMPKVRYLRMSSITPGTITALLRDGKTTRLHPGISNVSRELFANLRIPDANMTSKPDANGPVFVLPQLKVMEVQDLPPAELVALVESRRRIGMPLVKVYIKGEQLKRMNSNIHKLIVDNNCLCEPLPNSQTTTKEEVAVLDEESFRKMYNLSQAPTPASFTR